jgi:hypothetical protein
MMYMIALELNARPADQYPDLDAALKALGNWSNRIRGTWLVESRMSASQIRDLIKPALVTGKDRVFVARISRNWAGMGMGEGFPEWLNRRTFDASAPAVPASGA